MNASALYKAGRLNDAVAAATEDVKRHPADSTRRGLLAQLLCFAGEWERADAQLAVVAEQAPDLVIGIGLLRQLIRAEQARQMFFVSGALPEFLEPPSPLLKRHLDASIRIRECKLDEAAAVLQQAEDERPRLQGTCNGEAFDDFRDLDDLIAPITEVLTSNGKYYWVPTDRIERIEFYAPERPHDLLWRRVRIEVAGGPDGEVFLPVLYPGAAAEADERVRLGRLTDWRGGEGSPVRGIGQRMFLVGDEGRSILEFREIAFQVSEDAHAQTAE